MKNSVQIIKGLGVFQRFIQALAIGLVSLLLLEIGGRNQAFAQTPKHPRVMELEKNLAKEAIQFLKGRFPDKPFLVTVKIDPLLREGTGSGRQEGSTSEKLPYFDLADDEIIDEWDDPVVPLATLVNRVKKVQVNISVPNQLTDDELAELKSSLFQNLGLVDIRDTVDITKRNWTKPTDSIEMQNKGFPWEMLGVGVLLILVCAFVLFGLSNFGVNKITEAIRESGQHSKGGGGGGGAGMVAVASGGPGGNFGEPTGASRQGQGASDIRLMDPIKNREIISAGLKILQTHAGFPGLEDMLIFHRAAEEMPRELGALLGEFPTELKEAIFSYSYGDSWLSALTDPSDVGSGALEILNRCLKCQRSGKKSEWDEFLILVWRLDNKAKEFFAGIPQADAFAILYDLPKAFALSAARESFPGAWGQLLDPHFHPAKLAENKLVEYRKKALKISALRNSQVLTDYQKEKELLEFLKTCDPQAEKEIYQASGEDSVIWKIRPPFFRIFELKPEEISKIFNQFRIEDWAVAFLNVSRTERREIEKHMTDKQKFRYFETLKALDIKNPSRQKVGHTRELVGRAIQTIYDQQLQSQNASEGSKSEGSGEEGHEKRAA